jgi:hypothetical protein
LPPSPWRLTRYQLHRASQSRNQRNPAPMKPTANSPTRSAGPALTSCVRNWKPSCARNSSNLLAAVLGPAFANALSSGASSPTFRESEAERNVAAMQSRYEQSLALMQHQLERRRLMMDVAAFLPADIMGRPWIGVDPASSIAPDPLPTPSRVAVAEPAQSGPDEDYCKLAHSLGWASPDVLRSELEAFLRTEFIEVYPFEKVAAYMDNLVARETAKRRARGIHRGLPVREGRGLHGQPGGAGDGETTGRESGQLGLSLLGMEAAARARSQTVRLTARPGKAAVDVARRLAARSTATKSGSPISISRWRWD